MTLRDEDAAVVREAMDEILGTPPPPDRGPAGCVVALPGFVMLLLYPPVARMLGLPGWLAVVVVSAGILFLAVGLILWFTAGTLGRRHAVAAAEAGLRALESWSPEQGDREEALRAATLMLMNSFAQSGTTAVTTFDADDARRRIAHRMPLVEAVERYLLEQAVLYPLFTLEEEPSDPAEAPPGDET
jgi:hypothetical protein